MRLASDFEVRPRLRWTALLLVLAGHGAIGAALVMAAIVPPVVSPPGVLSVRWLGDDKPAEAAAEPEVKPRPLPMKPLPQPRTTQRSEDRPAPTPVAEPAASEAAAAEPAAPLMAAAPGAGVAAEPTPIVAPRFDADYLSNPAPAYPQASRAMAEQGKVFLRVLVSARGDAQAVAVATSSGHERLDSAALEAVRHWKFVPARQGSEAVVAWVIVPISFTLRR